MSSSSVLIDTPIWQKYFRKEERTFRQVNILMDEGRVCSLGLVVAELLQTAETEEELKMFRGFTKIFPILQEKSGSWVEAAQLLFEFKQKGKILPLRDCYLAVMARAHAVLLYTTNKSLYKNRQLLGLNFFTERRSK